MVLNIVLHIPKNEDQKEIQYDENEEIGEDFLDNAIKIRTEKTKLKLLYKQLEDTKAMAQQELNENMNIYEKRMEDLDRQHRERTEDLTRRHTEEKIEMNRKHGQERIEMNEKQDHQRNELLRLKDRERKISMEKCGIGINTISARINKTKLSLKKANEEMLTSMKRKFLEEEKKEDSDLIPECPVCLDEMLPPKKIYQCEEGHLLCSDCRPKLKTKACVTCTNKSGYKSRSRFIEDIVRKRMKSS